MKVLVTGGAGFIGSYIVDELIKGNHEVVILDSLEDQVHQGKMPDYVNREATFIKGNVGDAKVLEKALEGIEAISHQAAVVGVGQSMYHIERYINKNTLDTAKLLQYLIDRKNDVKKLVVASSMSIYGEGKYKCDVCGAVYPKLRDKKQLEKRDWEMKCPICGENVKAIPTDEDKPLFPNSVYAISKMDQELLFLNIGRAYGIKTIALRYFNVYGPRQALNNPYTGVCAIFSSRIKNNNPPLIFEDGLQSRDFISVKDIARANILALKSQINNDIFNIGTGEPRSILQIANLLIKKYKKIMEPKRVNKFREGDIRHCFADTKKAEKLLGFKAKEKFEEGIQALIEWADKQEAEDKSNKAQMELEERGLVG